MFCKKVQIIVCLPFLLCSCGGSEQYSIDSNNINDFVTISTQTSSLKRGDGTLILSTSRLYSDSQFEYKVVVKPKEGYEINRIDLVITCNFDIGYFVWVDYLGMNQFRREAISLQHSDIVVGGYVNSYSYTYSKPKMVSVFPDGLTIEYAQGTVTKK